MLPIPNKTLTLAETICSVVSGEVVPHLYELEASASECSVPRGPSSDGLKFSLRRKKRVRASPLNDTASVSPVMTPSTKPPNTVSTQWILQHLDTKRGVMASVPVNSTTIALSSSLACGHPQYWLHNFDSNSASFNEAKTRTCHYANKLVFEANLLADGVPPFLPEGDVYGLKHDDMDPYLDAGICVEIRKQPYYSKHETVAFLNYDKQLSLCAKELAFAFQMARKGVAPCIVAAFFTHASSGNAQDVEWGETPNAYVPSSVQCVPQRDKVTSLVLVTQISTFSLDSLMEAINKAPVDSRKNHLVGVLSSACASVFALIGDLIVPQDGYSMVKLNVTPESVVFCPKLVASGKNWTLEGVGFMPVSNSYLDGVPKLVDFSSVFTTRVRESSFCFNTSFVLHCMLLVVFTHCKHGAYVSAILWNHLLAKGDPSGFVKAAKNMQSKSIHASAFLASLAADSDMRESPEVSKAVAELVSDMDCAVRDGVVGSDGYLSMKEDRPMFSKLVSIVYSCNEPDTCIFARNSSNYDCSVEMMHALALDVVKQGRIKRLKSLK